MDDPSPPEIEAALADAQTARKSLVADGNWLRTYLLVFASASVVLVLLIGLDGQRGSIVGTTLWGLLVAGMSSWGARQRVILKEHKRRSILAFGSWGVLYGATLLLGELVFADEAVFWVPAAALTAVPLVLVACWPTSGSDRRGPGSLPIASNE